MVLRREVAHLKSECLRYRSLIYFKDEMLQYTAHLLEEILQTRQPISGVRLKRLISQLRGAKDKTEA